MVGNYEPSLLLLLTIIRAVFFLVLVLFKKKWNGGRPPFPHLKKFLENLRFLCLVSQSKALNCKLEKIIKKIYLNT